MRVSRTRAELGIVKHLSSDDTQKDVFESPDVIKSETGLHGEYHLPHEKENDDLDRGPYDKAAALAYFRRLNTSPDGDFSVPPRGQRFGVLSLGRTKNEYETPAQQYRRLRAELSEFEERMKAMAPASEAVPVLDIPAGLVTDIRKLQSQLDNVAISTAQQPLQSKLDAANLVSRLAQHSQQQQQSANAVVASTELSQIVELEAKVAALEKKLGDGMLGESYPTILSAINDLESRLALLGPNRIERIKSQFAMLEQEAAARRKKKDGEAEPSIDDHKLNKLYTTVEQWEAVSRELPILVARLHSLKILHEQSAHAHNQISTISSNQASIQNSLSENADILAKVKASLEENIQIVAQNSQQLSQRIMTIEEKVKK